MSLDSEISTVMGKDSVESVEFIDGLRVVRVVYDSQTFFQNWKHGAKEGTQEQQEEYYQEQLGVDWSLEEVTNRAIRNKGTYQAAIFNRF